MKILALESSAVSASVALTEDEKLVAQSFQNCGLTHSRTLLPMVENLLANCGVSLADVDAIAVAHGPGSFTGVRIGVATVKGLALGADKPCLGVSTLEAMAWGARALGGDLCCVMDARAGQVYNALFTVEDGSVRRLCDDRAIKLTELAEEIGEAPYFLVGDGADLCYNTINSAVLIRCDNSPYRGGIYLPWSDPHGSKPIRKGCGGAFLGTCIRTYARKYPSGGFGIRHRTCLRYYRRKVRLDTANSYNTLSKQSACKLLVHI